LKTIFEAENPNINLTWVAVGTGQALEIGKRGDADVVLVHARAQEDQFINGSYGIHGITIAYNDFVILGPNDDPAGINSTSTAAEAFKKIADLGTQGKTTFISRGDGSGTQIKELDIWKKAGINVTGQTWYKEVGQGMAQTLRIAENLQGYVLTDRATYYSLMQELSLKLLFEGDPFLLNTYRVMLINPAKFPYVHYAEAHKFVLFLVSPEIQEFIGNYTKGGLKLFNPVFGKTSTIGINDPYEDQEVAYWKSKLQG
jgi:tungstate transport system substrate-binding protein